MAKITPEMAKELIEKGKAQAVEESSRGFSGPPMEGIDVNMTFTVRPERVERYGPVRIGELGEVPIDVDDLEHRNNDPL